ncbi:hypothetical protein L1887_30917 [Cichorium endivia]|nr:hypothetical protein L1887_30917 [Cichorium endivia]
MATSSTSQSCNRSHPTTKNRKLQPLYSSPNPITPPNPTSTPPIPTTDSKQPTTPTTINSRLMGGFDGVADENKVKEVVKGLRDTIRMKTKQLW